MNKKSKMIMALALSSVAVVSVAGCSTADKKEEVKKFTKEEETAFVKSFSEKVLKPESPAVILAEVEKNVDKLSKQEASNMVDGLLYVMHQRNPEMNAKIQGLQTPLAELDKEKIDFNNPKNLDKVKDETTKAFLKESQEKLFVVQKVGQDYLARPNVQYVLDTFGSYMNDDLKAMTAFSLEENEKPFFNKDANSFDMNIVVSRILKVEDNMKKFPESFYKEAMTNSKNYYYQVYFGTNNSFLVDENKKVLPAIVDHYNDTVKKHPDSQLAKDAKTVLEKLKATDNKVTDDLYVFLLELTGTQTQDVQEDASATEEKATKKVNEAIQQAIEDNKGTEETKTTEETKATEDNKTTEENKK
ncbi:hypothetical protein CVD28_03795 [Bacillus sp. M6-12]|uniref:hypothetical protein n=1 Tax=Bacillus sp. M6-12 TaxID=2054166 RepID=UPI000C76DDBE|nr:hypothetical protein [Bacillus sp. M6-12]PLS19550.1 hypothetical protein CVD28_03795 [Bacillus sp. M6-12]